MSIRLIAIDLDGTLLHDDMTISTYLRDVIRRAMEKGYRIVIATGRMWDSAKPKVDLLHLGNVPVICYTGAWIMMSETEEAIWKDGIDPKLARDIFLEAKEKDWVPTGFWNGHIYMEKPTGTEAKYQKYRTQTPIYLGEDFYHPKDKVTRIVFADPTQEGKDAIRHDLEEKFGDQIDVIYPGDDFVDIHKKGINKAQALSYLLKQFHIQPEEIMAFGNTENDVPMLQMADASYAVANADEVAKRAAKYTCESNEDDGVAKTIEKALLL